MEQPKDPRDRLSAMINGWRLSQAVSVAAALGIADALGGGPRSSAELASTIVAHEPSLYRLLRALAAAGVLREGPSREFELTDVGEFLRADAPGSVRGWAVNIGRPYMQAAWANLGHSIRTGENAFTALHGEDVWHWRAHEPVENEIFNEAMVSLTAGVAPAVAEAFDFGAAETVADLGGGSGALLATILSRYPATRGILFDQPHVVSSEATRELLAQARVLDRVEIVGGSFFESVPAADVYVMKAILHDWEDEPSVRILETIKRAAGPRARLVVVDAVVGPPNEDLASKLSDLNMLVMPGGRERTEAEWRELFVEGGWSLVEIRPGAGTWKLLIAAPG